MEIAIGYVFLSFVVGILGRKNVLGFWGNFIFSLFLSPFVPLIFVLISSSRDKKQIAVKK